tara:strand:- start:540 stop:953 length:414 start_codon:yes stop_codon:yes gene_type:complete
MFYINDFEIGHSVHNQVEITQDLHDSFMLMSGDNSPIHTDYKFAKKSNYKKTIGYAFLITALLSKIYGTIFPGGSELCLKQECNFKKEYYVGDTLLFVLKVIHKNLSLNLVTIDVSVFNQDNEVIFNGETLMKLSLG